MGQDVQERLARVFKLNHFRTGQLEVIQHVMGGGSGLVIMPTGFGKSLTYQLPATLLEGTTVVLSPLKALMKDQVDKLRGLGVRATYINSALRKEEREKRQNELAQGRYQIIYVTPERFLKSEFRDALSAVKIAFVVVDEAHCISQWGQDFRPEYGKVGQLLKSLGSPQVLALTATATPTVREDIQKQLQIEKAPLFAHSIRRENLKITVHDLYGWESKCEKFMERSRVIQGSQIVYFSLIQSIHEFSKSLQKMKIPFQVYHGDLPENERRRTQQDFLQAEKGILLATPAFGLGIDKPNVRAVFHAEVPGSIEAYFQEIGRGGRDGNIAYCEFLFDEEDIATQMEFIKWSNPDAAFIRSVARLIQNNPLRFQQERAEFIRSEMNFYNRRDFRAETTIQLLESWGVLEGHELVSEVAAEQLAEESRQKRFKVQNEKLLLLLRLLKSEKCRMQGIHDYFHEPLPEPCGICDNCEAQK